jgi:hypothetical protein
VENQTGTSSPSDGASCSESSYAEATFILSLKLLIINKELITDRMANLAHMMWQQHYGSLGDVRDLYPSVKKACQEL